MAGFRAGGASLSRYTLLNVLLSLIANQVRHRRRSLLLGWPGSACCLPACCPICGRQALSALKACQAAAAPSISDQQDP
jgi:hypothetical protein